MESLNAVLQYLRQQDARLGFLFDQVGPLDWPALCKPLYVALIAAVTISPLAKL